MRFNLACDSGAFTMFNKFFSKGGAKMTSNKARSYDFRHSPEFVGYLERYINFLKKRSSKWCLDFYVTMDVLDHLGMTLELMKEIESHGLTPMPVYHYGEPLSVFKAYADKYEYIGLGGAAPIRAKGLVPFVDPVFEYLCGPGFKKPPAVKIHALGMTSPAFMGRYPIFSFDSTAWLQLARNGAIMFPRTDLRGVPIWFLPFIRMPMTAKNVKGNLHHLKTITPSVRRAFFEWIHEAGFTLEELHEEHSGKRSLMNLVYWFRLQTALSKNCADRFNYPQGGKVYVSGSPRNLVGKTPDEYEFGLKRSAAAAHITEINYLTTFYYPKDIEQLIEVHTQWT